MVDPKPVYDLRRHNLQGSVTGENTGVGQCVIRNIGGESRKEKLRKKVPGPLHSFSFWEFHEKRTLYRDHFFRHHLRRQREG